MNLEKWKENTKLATWVNEQRRLYRWRVLGRACKLDDDRVSRLESIGFEWSVMRGGRRRVEACFESEDVHLTAIGTETAPTASAQGMEQAQGMQTSLLPEQQPYLPPEQDPLPVQLPVAIPAPLPVPVALEGIEQQEIHHRQQYQQHLVHQHYPQQRQPQEQREEVIGGTEDGQFDDVHQSIPPDQYYYGEL
mmetsp:Transcript_20442/g.59200  ORF Transcript_20442/g.59200 Transcript_20442/m.59200 type:complete len:192 (+) Transcript_20442:2654-3229(+)